MAMATGMPMAYTMGVPMTMCTGTSTIGKHASWRSWRFFGIFFQLVNPIRIMFFSLAECPSRATFDRSHDRFATIWNSGPIWARLGPKRGIFGQNGPFWQCVTRSLFQFSRRERELLSFDLVFETRTRISFSQSRASRRERESRLRQFSREFSGITFITCLLRDIFKKRVLFSKNFLK